MPRITVTRPFSYNLTGYDAVATAFAPGEQDVPEAVAAWVAENPEFGAAIVATVEEPTEPSPPADEEEAPDGVEPDDSAGSEEPPSRLKRRGK